MARINMHIEDSIHKALRVQAVERETTMTALITEAVLQWLEGERRVTQQRQGLAVLEPQLPKSVPTAPTTMDLARDILKQERAVHSISKAEQARGTHRLAEDPRSEGWDDDGGAEYDIDGA